MRSREVRIVETRYLRSPSFRYTTVNSAAKYRNICPDNQHRHGEICAKIVDSYIELLRIQHARRSFHRLIEACDHLPRIHFKIQGPALCSVDNQRERMGAGVMLPYADIREGVFFYILLPGAGI